MCRQVGLVKLGHVSLDGTKVKANASKHKAMSDGRMEKKAEELEVEVKRLLTEAQAVDEAEDGQYGKGQRGAELPKDLTKKERMARKLRTKKGRETYAKRQEIVEPVFGQIKEVRGFRRFSLRGLGPVMSEWDLICLTQNLLKLFRSGLMPTVA